MTAKKESKDKLLRKLLEKIINAVLIGTITTAFAEITMAIILLML